MIEIEEFGRNCTVGQWLSDSASVSTLFLDSFLLHRRFSEPQYE